MLAGQHLVVRHPPGAAMRGWPLPAVRKPAAADGSITQPYRPIAVLELVADRLSRQRGERRADDDAG
jgi:hypothetical protein